VFDTKQQKEIQTLLEAVRKAAYAEGYAAAKMEEVFSGASLPVAPEDRRVGKELPEQAIEEEHEYISRTPASTTRAIVLDYIKKIAPRAAGPTEVIRNTGRKTGVSISYASVRRAFDDLQAKGLVVEVDRSRWRLK
jgi:hypothetical protein